VRQGVHIRYHIADPSVIRLWLELRSVAERQIAEMERVLDACRHRRHELEKISVDELQARLRSGDVILIDVRPREEYQAGHLPGAISIPLGELEPRVGFGPLSDRLGRKSLIMPGMALQGVGILSFVLLNSQGGYFLAAALTGLGTAMVYPTLLALVSDVAEPAWRASSLGVYRFWRDLGYAVGALGAGLLADALNIPTGMVIVAGLAFLSAVIVAIRAKETKI
jgi:hypothetical protein